MQTKCTHALCRFRLAKTKCTHFRIGTLTFFAHSLQLGRNSTCSLHSNLNHTKLLSVLTSDVLTLDHVKACCDRVAAATVAAALQPSIQMVVSSLLEVLLLCSSWQHIEEVLELLLLRSINSVAAVTAQLLRSISSRRRQWSRDDERRVFFSESVTETIQALRRPFAHHNNDLERARGHQPSRIFSLPFS